MPRKSCEISPTVLPIRSGFNEAAAVMPRKSFQNSGEVVQCVLASMRPRQ